MSSLQQHIVLKHLSPPLETHLFVLFVTDSEPEEQSSHGIAEGQVDSSSWRACRRRSRSPDGHHGGRQRQQEKRQQRRARARTGRELAGGLSMAPVQHRDRQGIGSIVVNGVGRGSSTATTAGTRTRSAEETEGTWSILARPTVQASGTQRNDGMSLGQIRGEDLLEGSRKEGTQRARQRGTLRPKVCKTYECYRKLQPTLRGDTHRPTFINRTNNIHDNKQCIFTFVGKTEGLQQTK